MIKGNSCGIFYVYNLIPPDKSEVYTQPTPNRVRTQALKIPFVYKKRPHTSYHEKKGVWERLFGLQPGKDAKLLSCFSKQN